MPNIQLPADILFTLWGFPITNAHFSAFAITIFFLVFALIVRRKFGIVPSRIQVVLELLIEFVMKTLTDAYGSEKQARRFFPLIATLLFFIGVANQFSLVPLISQITVGDVSLFRTPTSVLGNTMALSLIVILLAQILAITASPIGYIGKFINIKALFKARSLGGIANGFLEFFLGILDLIGEIAKVVSLGARLFGNIFAGEVMVAVIASLAVYTQFFVPIPFIIISTFSGFVQTLVFVLLSVQFIGASLQMATSTKHKELQETTA